MQAIGVSHPPGLASSSGHFRAGLGFPALPSLYFGPSIFQRYRAIEDQAAGLGVRVYAEVPQALELISAAYCGIR